MALEKTHTLENGVAVNYWAIKQATEFDYHAQVCRLWILAWVSATAKSNGSGYVSQATRNYYVSVEDFNTYFADSVLQESGKSPASQAYTYIIAKDPFFADATLV